MIVSGYNFTLHDSSAVVACAKLWPDLIIVFTQKNNNWEKLSQIDH